MKVLSEMHRRYIPLAHISRHIEGIAPSLSRKNKRALRHDTIKRLSPSRDGPSGDMLPPTQIRLTALQPI